MISASSLQKLWLIARKESIIDLLAIPHFYEIDFLSINLEIVK